MNLKSLLNILTGFFGCAFVLLGLFVLNGKVERKQDEGTDSTSAFEIVKTEKKKKPKPKKIVRKSRPKKRNKAVTPNLSSLISGSSFGVDAFEVDLNIGEGLLGDMSNVAMTEDTVDIAPSPVQRPPLEYPKNARAKGITGYVVLNVLVTQSGNVEKVKILDSLPVGTFDLVASNSVKDWKFKPAMYQGEPVAVWVKQKIKFSLN